MFIRNVAVKRGEKPNTTNGVHGKGVLAREDGFVTIAIVLMMLVLVTLIGVSAVNMSTIESFIVRSDSLYKRNFYIAESTANESAQLLENAPTRATDVTGSLAWVNPRGTDMTHESDWRTGSSWKSNSMRSQAFYTKNPGTNKNNLDILLPGSHAQDEIHLASVFRGYAPGSGKGDDNPDGIMYVYSIYGMYSNLAGNLGEALVEMGYYKRFL